MMLPFAYGESIGLTCSSQESPPPEPTPVMPSIIASSDVAMDGRRPSTSASHTDLSGGPPPRNSSVPIAAPSYSPSQAQYQPHMGPSVQSLTPGMVGGLSVQQTPVPVPQPAYGATTNPSHMQMRPMQYQPHMYSPTTVAQYPNSAALPTHHQSMHQPMNHHTYGSATTHPSVRSASASAGTSGGPPHGAMYNPPRPAEVYTLPDTVNEAFPQGVVEHFQTDPAGRLLFFTAPPLERSHKGLSPGSRGLGHSAKYLDGYEKWRCVRERKRKLRDDDTGDESHTIHQNENVQSHSAHDSTTQQATRALGKWFGSFDDETSRWRKQAGLEGWQKPVPG